MERIVIAAYKPKPGKEQALEELMETHWSVLNSQGLVSMRRPVTARSEDGTFIEVFGWRSAEAIREAHSNPEVLKMWESFAGACDYIPVKEVPESSELFSEFTPFSIKT